MSMTTTRNPTTAQIDDLLRRKQNAELEADRKRANGDHDLAMYFDGKAEAFSQAIDVIRG